MEASPPYLLLQGQLLQRSHQLL
jgi:hypothetical protein